MNFDCDSLPRSAVMRTRFAILFAAVLSLQSPAGLTAPAIIRQRAHDIAKRLRIHDCISPSGPYVANQRSRNSCARKPRDGSASRHQLEAVLKLRFWCELDSYASACAIPAGFPPPTEFLVGNELSVAYTSITGEVRFSVIHYDQLIFSVGHSFRPRPHSNLANPLPPIPLS